MSKKLAVVDMVMFTRGVYDGMEIAVKKLHQFQGLDDKAFDTEFRNLSKVEHQNIVRLIGYCYEVRGKYIPYNEEVVFGKATERILCFEYMQGGSLDHISDLGLSRLVASTETHKTEIINIKGTLGYMPPEYIDGGYISNRFDVFSLGVIILKIIAGKKGYYCCYEMSPEQFTKHVKDIISLYRFNQCS